MDGKTNTISPDDFYGRLDAASAALTLGTRGAGDSRAKDRVIVTSGDENVR
jgi:hypothetical protein